MKKSFFKSLPFLLILFIILFAIAIWMSFYFEYLRNQGRPYHPLTAEEQAILIQRSSSSGQDMLSGTELKNVIKNTTAISATSSLTQNQEQALINAMSGH